MDLLDGKYHRISNANASFYNSFKWAGDSINCFYHHLICYQLTDCHTNCKTIVNYPWIYEPGWSLCKSNDSTWNLWLFTNIGYYLNQLGLSIKCFLWCSIESNFPRSTHELSNKWTTSVYNAPKKNGWYMFSIQSTILLIGQCSTRVRELQWYQYVFEHMWEVSL